MKLIIENIRSFAGRHMVDLKPLTLLVGENSSGKSTLLAALAALSDTTAFPGKLSFNKEPHDLGAYRTIATYKSGQFGRAKSFSIGFKGEAGQPEVLATYKEARGDSVLARLKVEDNPLEVDLSFDEEKMTGVLRVKPGGAPQEIKIASKVDATSVSISETLPHFILRALRVEPQMQSASVQFTHLLQSISCFVPETRSIAPIRSKPRRVYASSNVGYEPGGDHIPYILSKLLNDKQNQQRDQLSKALNKFGEQSGLFKKIAAPLLGTHQGDPFEIEVSIAGPATNLLDVGYGVSQSLPIIVESLLAAPSTRLLVQQPEVHLHPRAQAALGSFLVDMVRDGQRQFVVETHSDYIIDRIRQEVAAGRLPAESMAIVFLEKPHIETTVHQLKLDEAGNLLDAPPTYRSFFLEEEMNLLSRVP
jgi:energy-coupling factor transporter ATP-binding protein EcfA2